MFGSLDGRVFLQVERAGQWPGQKFERGGLAKRGEGGLVDGQGVERAGQGG